MDKFIIKTRKKETPFDSIPGALCVWGPHGCGKTTWVKSTFGAIEINYDSPQDFMEKIEGCRWVLIDNYEDLDKSIYEKYYSRPLTLFVCKYAIDDIHCYEFPNKRVLVPRVGEMDIHKEPKQIIIENITQKSKSYIHLIDSCEGEHGNNIGIIEENLMSSTLNLTEISTVLDSLAHAFEIDDKMYQGNWDLFKIFNVFGYAIPCYIIQGKIQTILPASIWSKFLNMKMRSKKMKENNLDFETIQLLREYAIQGESPEHISKENIEVLKYGDFFGRLKNKHIQKLKKAII